MTLFTLRNVLLIAIAGFVIAGIITFLLYKAQPQAQGRATVLTAVASVLIGLGTNVITAFAITEAADNEDRVSMDSLSEVVKAGVPFSVSGTAHVTGDNELWIIVYRQSGGFDVANRDAVNINSDGRWTFSPVVAGRPAADGQPSTPGSSTRCQQ